MAVVADVWSWSSAEASNSPSGSDTVGTTPDDILRKIQAAVRAAFEPLTSVSGTNTITASMANLAAYTSGLTVRFVPDNSNTGATTININSFGARNIYLNGAALVGYELRKNCPVQLHYDGTQFNIISGAHGGDGVPLGTIKEFSGDTAPNGYIFPYGQAVSRTTYADYFALVSTTYGSGDGSTTFNVPDRRGRVAAGKDDMGGSSANRLTNQSGGLNGDTLGATGGSETHTLTGAESGTSVHSHGAGSLAGSFSYKSSASIGVQTVRPLPVEDANSVGSWPVSISGSTSNSSAANASAAHNNVQPTIVMNFILKV